jgi:hypothetical protein
LTAANAGEEILFLGYGIMAGRLITDERAAGGAAFDFEIAGAALFTFL